jgi:uncharacterized protein YigA (DUF484 family)
VLVPVTSLHAAARALATANERLFNEIRELQLREQSHKDDVQRISTELRERAAAERATLEELTEVAGEIERASADTSERFSASAAYHALVLRRLQELGELLDIATLPTLLLLKGGEEVHRLAGVPQQRPSRALSLAIRRHLLLGPSE